MPGAATLKPLYNYMDDLPALKASRRRSCRASMCGAPRARYRASISAAAAPTSARSAPSSTCRAARAASARPTISRRSCARTMRRASSGSSSPTTISPATGTGRALFDRMIELRKSEGLNIGFTIQVDTLCHKIPNFIEKAAQAGVRRVFIGLENINPDNLIAAKKRQNKITEYREMLQKWRDHGAITYAGYILGFPADTKESILRDIEIIKRELPLDILEFFFLTPLPGSEDHKVLSQKGVWMDPDINKYDLNHRVSHHAKMSDAEWEEAYRAAWAAFYTPEHMRTILRRAAACKIGRPGTTLSTILWFYLMIVFEGVHPLEGGAFRLKFRRDRRLGMPLESPLVFYPRYGGETLPRPGAICASTDSSGRSWTRRSRAPDRWTYSDLAIAPPQVDEFERSTLSRDQRRRGCARAQAPG